MLQHAIDAAEAAGVDEIVIVLGHDADRIEAAIRLPRRSRVVVNPDFASGQSSSLRTGLAAASDGSEAAVILLGDQPGVVAGAIRAIIDAYGRSKARVVRASYGGRPGHPVLLARETWDEVAALEGDVGARELVAAHPEWVAEAEVGGEEPPDVDSWANYERVRPARPPESTASDMDPEA
jgi:molybdenum cofactor cytidylyltransferase